MSVDDLIDAPVIVEFGGGYGEMASLIHHLGFHGLYVIIDYPEFLLLQEYYLSNVLSDNAEILYVMELPLWVKPDVVIGLYSICEAPDRVVSKFFRNTPQPKLAYLFSLQEYFFGRRNNREFLERLLIKYWAGMTKWVFADSHFSPDHFYMVGYKQGDMQ
jgi:hypothetical protein